MKNSISTIYKQFVCFYQRFECEQLWGEVKSVKPYIEQPDGARLKTMITDPEHDVIVDKVARSKGIFEGCDWKPFVSVA